MKNYEVNEYFKYLIALKKLYTFSDHLLYAVNVTIVRVISYGP